MKACQYLTKGFSIVSIALFIVLFSCKKDDVKPNTPTENAVGVTFNFRASADGMTDFMNGMIMFTNAYGNQYGVTKLRYLVSDIVLHKTDGTEYHISQHHFVDISDNTTLSFSPSTTISPGNYDHIEMVFGLTPSNNQSNSQPDLNLLSWNWPTSMGGGYHFMQLEGKYISSTGDTNYYTTHLGATVDTTSGTTVNNEIHLTMNKNFTVPEGASKTTIDIMMSIEQWYTEPNNIDLNQYGGMIMGNYEAQLLFHQNGEAGVFSVQSVSTN